jgi:type VI secretion system secreted protein Hcp
VSFKWGVTSPRDAATGQATGRRQYTPITITKHIDKASPLILNALANNENLRTIDLVVAAPGGTGDTLVSYRFTDANLVSRNVVHTGAAGDVPLEEVSFTFAKISETVGTNVAEDDTSARASP